MFYTPYRVLLSVVLPSGTGRLSDLDSLIGGYAFPWYLPRVPEWGSMAVCSITEYRVEFRQCYFMIRNIAIVSIASIVRFYYYILGAFYLDKNIPPDAVFAICT